MLGVHGSVPAKDLMQMLLFPADWSLERGPLCSGNCRLEETGPPLPVCTGRCALGCHAMFFPTFHLPQVNKVGGLAWGLGWRGLVHCSLPSCQGRTPKISRGAGSLHQENLVQPGQRVQAYKFELCWDKAPPLPHEKLSHGTIDLLLFLYPLVMLWNSSH